VCDGAGDPNTAHTTTAIATAAKSGTANSLKFIDRNIRTAIFKIFTGVRVANVTAIRHRRRSEAHSPKRKGQASGAKPDNDQCQREADTHCAANHHRDR
jgi:hypothetical protein